MPTLLELGIDLYKIVGLNNDNLHLKKQIEEGKKYLKEYTPRYRINKHFTYKTERFDMKLNQHLLITRGKGNWSLTIVDPRNRLLYPDIRSWDSISFLEQALEERQEFLPPKNENEKDHREVQLFIYSNWHYLATNVFMRYFDHFQKPLPCKLEVGLDTRIGNGKRVDIVGIMPDTRPHLIEIGKQGKFGIIKEYERLVIDIYPFMKQRVLTSVIYYRDMYDKFTGLWKDLVLFTEKLDNNNNIFSIPQEYIKYVTADKTRN